jgi:hypothetical protein
MKIVECQQRVDEVLLDARLLMDLDLLVLGHRA